LFQYGNDGQIALDGSERCSSFSMQYTTEYIIEKKNSYPLLKCVPKIKEGKIFYLRATQSSTNQNYECASVWVDGGKIYS
jgi:hypothetical protein